MQTIQAFIERHSLTMTAEPTAHNEFMESSDPKAPRMFHYRCNIHKAEKPDSAVGNGLALTFSVGSGVIEDWARKTPVYLARRMRTLRAQYPANAPAAWVSRAWPPRNMADADEYEAALQDAAKGYRPDLASVLDCLASDCATFENARSFEEWAPELGYDPDSRKAERIYRAIGEQYRGLETLLGRDALQELMFETERE